MAETSIVDGADEVASHCLVANTGEPPFGGAPFQRDLRAQPLGAVQLVDLSITVIVEEIAAALVADGGRIARECEVPTDAGSLVARSFEPGGARVTDSEHVIDDTVAVIVYARIRAALRDGVGTIVHVAIAVVVQTVWAGLVRGRVVHETAELVAVAGARSLRANAPQPRCARNTEPLDVIDQTVAVVVDPRIAARLVFRCDLWNTDDRTVLAPRMTRSTADRETGRTQNARARIPFVGLPIEIVIETVADFFTWLRPAIDIGVSVAVTVAIAVGVGIPVTGSDAHREDLTILVAAIDVAVAVVVGQIGAVSRSGFGWLRGLPTTRPHDHQQQPSVVQVPSPDTTRHDTEG